MRNGTFEEMKMRKHCGKRESSDDGVGTAGRQGTRLDGNSRGTNARGCSLEEYSGNVDGPAGLMDWRVDFSSFHFSRNA